MRHLAISRMVNMLKLVIVLAVAGVLRCSYVYGQVETFVNCSSLDDPINGQVEFTNTTVGATANYTCNQGYVLSNGSSTHTCQANGVWSGSPPSCELNYTNFFDFGVDAGDTQFERSFNQTSPFVTLSIPIRILGVPESTLRVWEVGAVEFTDDFYQTIIPFLGDVEIRRFGTIFYRQTSNVTLLQRARDQLQELFPSSGNFTPTTLFIATWDRVAQRGGGSEANTFQVVVVADQQMTFVFFIYGDIQWGTGAIIGFIPRDVTWSFWVPGSQTNQTLNIDEGSNVGVTGVYIYRVDLCSVLGPRDDLQVCCSLDDPVNGQVELSNTTVGSTAIYTCNQDYILTNGNSTRTCEANGEWSGSPPSCESNNTNFIDFGVNAGDAQLELILLGNSNGGSPPINLPIPIQFFGRTQHTLFENANGIISFRRPFTNFTPLRFPLNNSIPLIAPFWNFVNNRIFGNIFYRQTSNVTLLQRARDQLRELFPSSGNFTPTTLFIATSDKVTEIGRGSQVNTFQAVIAADQQMTFVFFIYHDIQWSAGANIGFDAGDGSRFFMVPGALTNQTLNIDEGSNVGVRGVYIYRVDLCSVFGPRDAVDCCSLDDPVNGQVELSNTTVGSTANYTCNQGYILSSGSSTHTCGANGLWSGSPPSCEFNNTNFFDFGVNVGDTELEMVLDGSSPPINLSTPIQLIGRTHNTLFVNDNGILSFRLPFTEFTPRRFSLNSNIPLIAPFWSDVDITRFGNVFYRETSNATFLQRARDQLQGLFPSSGDFTPTTLFIATWDRVAQLGGGPQENTFQVVIAANQQMTFVFFIYDDIQWGAGANIGFDAGDGTRSFMVPGALTNLTLDIDEGSNVGVRGVYIYRLDLCSVLGPNNSIAACDALQCIADSLGAIQISCTRPPQQCRQLQCDIQNSTIRPFIRAASLTLLLCNQPAALQLVLYNTTDGVIQNETLERTTTILSMGIPLMVTVDHPRNSIGIGLSVQGQQIIPYTPITLNSVCPTGTTPPGTTPRTTPGTNTGAVIGGTTAGVIALVALVISLFGCFFYKKKGKISALHKTFLHQGSVLSHTCEGEVTMEMQHFEKHGSKAELNKEVASYLQDFPEEMLFHTSNLHLLDSVGQGEFGIVYRAHLTRSTLRRTECEIVAVKTIKGFLDSSDVANILKECLKMKSFVHPHVMGILGICLAGQAPYIVMPFMANGSLKLYLRKHRAELLISEDEDIDLVCKTQKRMIDMCLQIAKGMEYIAEHKLVHRDLAARNCMLDQNYVIKVADFGLSENTYAKSYFRQKATAGVKLPIKWMAYESLTDGIFSEKTDVWSFGVTCWEVFSTAKTPYPGIHPTSLIAQLENGERLPKPNNASCCDSMYEVMLSCWDADPEQRPTFAQLVTTITSVLDPLADYLDVVTGEEEAETTIVKSQLVETQEAGKEGWQTSDTNLQDGHVMKSERAEECANEEHSTAHI